MAKDKLITVSYTIYESQDRYLNKRAAEEDEGVRSRTLRKMIERERNRDKKGTK